MEGSAYTERTIEVVKKVRSRSPAIGTVIQAYLYRSEQDIQDLLSIGCRIRLCKGAYKEPPQVAYPNKEDVDASYVKLARLLLPSGFSRHRDPRSEDDWRDDSDCRGKQGVERRFRVQMLYGVRTDLQRRLVRDGYRVRIYIPYGRDWFPYFMRRLAERPANLGFLVRNFFR